MSIYSTNVYVYYAFYVTRFDTKLEELRVFLLCQFFCKNFCNTLYMEGGLYIDSNDKLSFAFISLDSFSIRIFKIIKNI